MLLSLENVTFGYLGVPILKDVCFSVHENERIGLLGANGVGKTTLLRLIVGELALDTGTIFRKNGIKIGYLKQDEKFDSDLSVFEAMKQVFSEDEKLLEKLQEAQEALSTAKEEEIKPLSSEIEGLNRRIAARDSYRAEVKIKTVLNGMGFEKMYGQKIATMSGGEKTRLALSKLLLEEPDLLILDEPTNHLDVKTLFWLEDYLKTVKSAILTVSHDRYFLDKITSKTLEIEGGKLFVYRGNYSKYRVLKEERLKEALAAYEKQQEEIERLQDYVNKNLVRATTAKSAQSRVNRLERMELLEKPVLPPPPPRFCFSYEQKPYETVIKAEKFDLFAGEKPLLRESSFVLMRGRKCALTGDNGTGKTTLLKFLKDESASVSHAKFTRIGYFDQEGGNLPKEERVLDFFWGLNPLMPRTDIQKLLARAGLFEEDMQKKIENLSGGLRAKLALAVLELQRANVLFLDEPTNHLDLAARESLEEALQAFDGTLLFVSHDRRFIERVADCIACIENQTLSFFDGTLEEYLKAKTEPKAQETKPQKRNISAKQTNGYRSKSERAEEAKRAQRIREIEKRLEALEQEEETLNAALAECAADYRKVLEISERLKELHAESDALYAEYETLI